MKIFCLANNYSQHNKSLSETLNKKGEPVVFCRADSALLKNGKPFFIPDDMGRIDCCGELVVRICRLGKTIPVRFAHRYYDAVTAGTSFTARDMLQRLSSNGQPWEMATSFDGSAAIGSWIPKDKLPDAGFLQFRLDINGETVHEGCAAGMLHGIDETISRLSRSFTLKTGDLLFTGCPGAPRGVNIDDHIEGFVGDYPVLNFYCK